MVCVFFGKQINYENLTIACQYVDSGVSYMGTHPDVRCPMKNDTYIPDCGQKQAKNLKLSQVILVSI